MAGELKKALLALDANDREQARLLSLIDPDYTGFSEAADSDYDGIRKVVDQMKEA
jgi:ABC-type phosphate/phosphonate transport system substrate-binding protein